MPYAVRWLHRAVLIAFFELDLESLASDLKTVHFLDGLVGGFAVVEADESEALGLAVLGHDSGGQDVAELLKERVELGVL